MAARKNARKRSSSANLTIADGGAVMLAGVTYRQGDEDKLEAALGAMYDGKEGGEDHKARALERLAERGQVEVHPSGMVEGAQIDQEVPPRRGPARQAKQAELTDVDPTLYARRQMGERTGDNEADPDEAVGQADPGDARQIERVVIQPAAMAPGAAGAAGEDDGTDDGTGSKPRARKRQPSGAAKRRKRKAAKNTGEGSES